jgi:hypothetical protein
MVKFKMMRLNKQKRFHFFTSNAIKNSETPENLRKPRNFGIKMQKTHEKCVQNGK